MPNTRKPARRRAAKAAQTMPAPSAESFTAERPAVEPVAAADAPVVSVLQLGSSLSIREVTQYATELKRMLAAGPTDIDASKLESIDTAGIQLLLVAAAAAQRRGYKMKLRGAHGIRSGAASALGLNGHLGELAEIVP